jgi:hypothetical protein
MIYAYIIFTILNILLIAAHVALVESDRMKIKPKEYRKLVSRLKYRMKTSNEYEWISGDHDNFFEHGYRIGLHTAIAELESYVSKKG